MKTTYYCKVTNKKLACFISNVAESAGFDIWGNSALTLWKGEAYPIYCDGKKIDHSGLEEFCQIEGHVEVSVDEFLALIEKPTVVTVTLNEDFEAVVEKESVTFGCHTVAWSKIEEIVSAHDKLRQ